MEGFGVGSSWIHAADTLLRAENVVKGVILQETQGFELTSSGTSDPLSDMSVIIHPLLSFLSF